MLGSLVDGTMVSMIKHLMFQDFFIFENHFAKIFSMYLSFYNFTKIKNKYKSFDCFKQPTVLFSIYQNNTWTIRH